MFTNDALLFSSSLPRASVDLSPEDFKRKVLEGKDHWVLDFYAPWCGPCQHFAPEFEILARVQSLSLVPQCVGIPNFSIFFEICNR